VFSVCGGVCVGGIFVSAVLSSRLAQMRGVCEASFMRGVGYGVCKCVWRWVLVALLSTILFLVECHRCVVCHLREFFCVWGVGCVECVRGRGSPYC